MNQFLYLLPFIWASFQSPVSFEEKASDSRPNIILIFADDMGYGDLGSYGAKDWETPNLDQLAKDGTSFTQFYVPHAVCSASRAALLTGTYANRLEIFGALDHTAKHGLNPEETTIAEMLKENGYQTGMVGKWHLGHLPEFLRLSKASILTSGSPIPTICGPIIRNPKTIIRLFLFLKTRM